VASSRHRSLGALEVLTAVHLGVFFTAITWAFGGNADWVRAPLSCLGSLGALITLSVVLGKTSVRPVDRRALRWLWPLGLFNLVALISLLNPGMKAMAQDSETVLVPLPLSPWIPSAAMPAAARSALWLFDCSYLACFNLFLTVRNRRVLRGLLLFAVGNTLVLAIFGTVQRLSHATGLYFGQVKSPQAYFFASFIYHNHWGSFIVLMSAACLGLTWHYGRRDTGRGFFYTLGFAGLVSLLFLAITVPLSTSRSCSLLLLVLLGGSFGLWTVRMVRQRRRAGEAFSGPLLGAIAAVLLGILAIWNIDREVIVARFSKTSEQVSQMQAAGSVGSRLELYRDTASMALAKPWFGWGAGSYPYVFYFYNTQEPNRLDGLPRFYHDAHNDWLQTAAEYGLIGSALLALCAIVPWIATGRGSRVGSIPRHLLAGCGLILLYAWVEFPFGNAAVVLTWWLLYFVGLRYGQISHHEDRPGSANAT